MSLLVAGLSHASAPVAVLERTALAGDRLAKLLHDVRAADEVSGAMVLSTCNRVEIYAEVSSFHGGLGAVSELLARHSGLPLAELTGHLYVHYADRAVQHLLAVTCGLESMVVGESQILGQVRRALALAREQGTLSGPLGAAGTLALRAGKRAHAQTGIDSAAPSLVSVGLAAALARLGRADLAGATVTIVGAGSMSALATASATRLGAGTVTILNRTPARARRLAASAGVTAAGLDRLADQLAAADLVISCTGAAGPVISADMVTAAVAVRAPDGPPLALLDLALPRDVAPEAAALPGVVLLSLADLATAGLTKAADEAVAAVRQIVAQEFATYTAASEAALVTPTVLALRARADEVVDAEIARLGRKLTGLDEQARRQVAQSMHRIADKLLHAPTVRVKELAGTPAADSYEAALSVLFDLDPAAVRAVASPDAALAGWQQPGDAP